MTHDNDEPGLDPLGVRELYRDREPLMAGAAQRLMPAVRLRRRRRQVGQRLGFAAVALLVVVVLGGTAVVVERYRAGAPVVVGGTPTASPAPAASQLQSSLGAELAVPAGWRVNDYFGCGEADDHPTLVRAQGAIPACTNFVPPDKEYVFIEADRLSPAARIGDDSATLVVHGVTVDGVPARRAEGAIAGHRYAGWLIIPGRHLQVYGRTNTAATLAAILDSVRLVDVDHVGCPTRPTGGRPVHSGLTTFVDPHPSSISVCYYGGQPLLQASTERTGTAAESLAAALNASAPGRGPVGDCLPGSFPTGYDAVLVVRSADGTERRVGVFFQPCLPRRMDNGDGEHQFSIPLLMQVMDGMRTGISFIPD